MDIICKIGIKDEPLEGVDDQIWEQFRDESCDQFVDIKSEFKIKEDPLNINFEDSKNNEIFKNLIFQEDSKVKAEVLDELRSSGSDLQELRRKDKATEKHDGKESKGSDCDLTFKSEEKLMSYLESPCQGKFKCVRSICYCNFESGSKNDTLSLRHKDKSILKTKSFKCSECDYQCNQKRKLKVHTLKHQNIKLFKCSECSHACNIKGNLQMHMLKHQNIKLFRCPECSYECNLKGNLKIHMLKHQKTKLFKCSECNYECNQKGHLKAHTLKHQNVKLFRCPECSYECNLKECLKSHMVKHKKTKLFKCSECSYECNQKGQLKVHMLKHQNIKLFSCPDCSYECNLKGSLKIHMLKHQNTKLFRCLECSYECNHKGNLKVHILKHLNIKEKCEKNLLQD